MFTHVKPAIRHFKPDNLRGRSLLKVVYVVLEPQYQSALSAAVAAINLNHPSIAVEISGYLIEELRDATNYETFQQDIATANIFIASLIFLEDLADKLVTAVERLGREYAGTALLARTHGQIASPTTLGKELAEKTGLLVGDTAEIVTENKDAGEIFAPLSTTVDPAVMSGPPAPLAARSADRSW